MENYKFFSCWHIHLLYPSMVWYLITHFKLKSIQTIHCYRGWSLRHIMYIVMFHCIIFRCSLCYCLVVRENCGYKNGTSHTQINWRRKSLGNWLLWCYLASLKCVVSWSGKIWKLCIKGIPFVSVKWKIKLNCTLSLIIFDNSTVDIMCLKPKYICHCVFTDMLVYIFAVQ